MAVITIDFNNIIKGNKLELLLRRVKPVPKTSLPVGLSLLLSGDELGNLQGLTAGKKRVSYINSDKFVDSIQGFGFFSYDQKKNVCEVLRLEGLSIEQLLLEIVNTFPSKSLVWAGIPLEDQQPLVEAEKLIASGFGHPHISDRSPSGHSFNKYGLCLLKHNDGDTESSSSTGDVEYVLGERASICNMEVCLSSEAIEYLRGLQDAGMSLNENGSFTQKEIAGNLECQEVDTEQVHHLNVKYDSLILGKEMGVPIAPGLYNFHSHPKAAYKTAKVKMGWPSPQDYVGFLLAFIEDNTILHIVASIEGIYILSMSAYCLENKEKLDRTLATFILEKYNFCGSSIQNPHIYTKKINSVSYRGSPLFRVQYLPWHKASQQFLVEYKSEDSNCFSNDITWKYYQDLYR